MTITTYCLHYPAYALMVGDLLLTVCEWTERITITRHADGSEAQQREVVR